MSELSDCPAGHSAVLMESRGYLNHEILGHYVQCSEPTCWEGPLKGTEGEAVAAWDRIMRPGDTRFTWGHNFDSGYFVRISFNYYYIPSVRIGRWLR